MRDFSLLAYDLVFIVVETAGKCHLEVAEEVVANVIGSEKMLIKDDGTNIDVEIYLITLSKDFFAKAEVNSFL